jgi:N-acetylated-alpha-linked acidic dipeptidase
LIKYGGLFRGLKVKNAQEHGAIGAILFVDPGSDGNITAANGYKSYPGTMR